MTPFIDQNAQFRDNEQIKEVYKREGGPPLRHGQNREQGISLTSTIIMCLTLIDIILIIIWRIS